MRSSVLLSILLAPIALAQTSVDDVVNYLSYSPAFASAGQPDAAQLRAASEAGFERIIYIAYSDQENSLPNEDRIVKDLGMEYVHVPVEWDAPTTSDFRMFAGVMRANREKKTLLHCQVNYRASAFSLLYRVIYGGVPLDEAAVDMESVWKPNDTWRALIVDVLDEHGVAADCPSCGFLN